MSAFAFSRIQRRSSFRLCGAFILLVIGILCSLVASAADERFVRVGKHDVHPTRLIARFSESHSEKSHLTKLSKMGVRIQRRVRGAAGLVLLEVSDDGLSKRTSSPKKPSAESLLQRLTNLRESGLFSYVEPDYVQRAFLVPTDARFVDDTLWGLRNQGEDGGVKGADIDAVHAWDITTGSTNVIVAVVDSGIRYSHRELQTQMWRNPGEIPNNRRDDDDDGFIDNIFGINTVNRSAAPMDDNDHGTHVAGTIGAAAGDGNGHVGVAWNVRLMACKFLAEDGFGFTSDAIECIDFAVSKGARIINLSWGGGPYSNSLFDSINDARNQGVLFVAAAGNEENNNDGFPTYPASFKLDNIISVAALDRKDRIASFSNYGQTVHIGAPGVEIYSTTSQGDAAYDSFDGTSMAAPHVSGVAALILSKFPDASVPELRTRLLSTTTPVSMLQNRTSTGGRVNAFQALSAAPDGTLELSTAPAAGSDLRAGDTVSVQVIVTDVIGVTNAIVVGRIEGNNTGIVFKNDGVGSDIRAGDSVYTADIPVPSRATALTLNLEVTAPGKSARLETIVFSVVGPPANDNFANAISVPSLGGLFFATNKLATLEPGEPVHAQIFSVAASVWWKWIPSRTVDVIIDTAGSSFDTVLAVYTNNNLRALREVASVDDVGDRLQGHVSFEAIAGVEYRILVAGYSSDDLGTVRLRVQPEGEPDTTAPIVTVTSPLSGLTITNVTNNKVAITGTASDSQPDGSGVAEVLIQLNKGLASRAFGVTNWATTNALDLGQNSIKIIAVDHAGNRSSPRNVTLYYRPLLSPNDLFANGAELLGRDGLVKVDSGAASKEFGEPNHAGNPGGKSVWWTYRPTSDGVLVLSTEKSSFDTLLAVYTGSRMTNLSLVASNNNTSSSATHSRIEQAVKAFETYRIAVDGQNGASGTVSLEHSFTPGTVYSLAVSASSGGHAHPKSNYYLSNSVVVLTAEALPNFQFAGWEGSIASQDNPLTIRMLSDLELRANFRGFDYLDDFESGDLKKVAWSVSGDLPWTVQEGVSSKGRYAARSGKINHGQKSILRLTVHCQAGTGAFDLKVGSEESWDTVEFAISSGRTRQRIGRWSGAMDWRRIQFPVPEGTNTFEWIYQKDFQTSVDPDAAFIDNLELPLFVVNQPAAPPMLGIGIMSGAFPEITISGTPNQPYLILVSPDLKSWETLATNRSSNGQIRIIDSSASDSKSRFYRAVTP